MYTEKYSMSPAMVIGAAVIVLFSAIAYSNLAMAMSTDSYSIADRLMTNPGTGYASDSANVGTIDYETDDGTIGYSNNHPHDD